MMTPLRRLSALAMLTASLTASMFAGCERREKVFDLETPDGGIEVFEDRDTGNVDVEIDSDRN